MRNARNGSTLKTVLCIVGVVILLGVLTVGGLCYWGYRTVKSHVSMNPQEVEQAAKQIMNYNIPGGSQGFMAFDLGKKMKLTLVQSKTNSPQILLMLASAEDNKSGNSEVQHALERTRPSRGETIQSMYTRKGTVCGQSVDVVYKIGSEERNTKTFPMSSMSTGLKIGNRIKIVEVHGVGENNETAVAAVFNSLGCNP